MLLWTMAVMIQEPDFYPINFRVQIWNLLCFLVLNVFRYFKCQITIVDYGTHPLLQQTMGELIYAFCTLLFAYLSTITFNACVSGEQQFKTLLADVIRLTLQKSCKSPPFNIFVLSSLVKRLKVFRVCGVHFVKLPQGQPMNERSNMNHLFNLISYFLNYQCSD